MDICRTLPSDSLVTCHYCDQWFTLKPDHSEFTLATLSAEAFPEADLEQEATSLSLDSHCLHHLLTQTAFAMAQQDVRFFQWGAIMLKDA